MTLREVVVKTKVTPVKGLPPQRAPQLVAALSSSGLYTLCSVHAMGAFYGCSRQFVRRRGSLGGHYGSNLAGADQPPVNYGHIVNMLAVLAPDHLAVRTAECLFPLRRGQLSRSRRQRPWKRQSALRSSRWRCGASFPCFTVLRFDGHGALGREVQGGMCVRLCVVWKLSSAVSVVGVVRLCGARPPRLPSCDSETGQALGAVRRARACVPRLRT